MTLKNPYPEQHDTHERQQGGNTSVSGEKHDQKKATTIPEDKRFSREVVTPAKEKE